MVPILAARESKDRESKVDETENNGSNHIKEPKPPEELKDQLTSIDGPKLSDKTEPPDLFEAPKLPDEPKPPDEPKE